MTLVSDSIPNLLNGVSQQPPIVRRSSQAQEQRNMLSDPVKGVRKRPHMRHGTKLSNSIPTTVFRHTIDRDSTEQYAVIIEDGTLRVWDLVAEEFKTVNSPSGQGYLAGATNGYAAVTAQDTTLIANRSTVVAKAATKSAARNPEAMVSVKAGGYSKTYEIIIDGTVQGTFTTPDSSTAANEAQIATDYIALQLVNSVNASAAVPDMTAVQYNSDIYLYTTDGVTDFTLTTNDGFGNKNMIGSKDVTDKISDLPSETAAGVKIKVTGSEETDADDYWVEYTQDGQSKAYWKETIAPDIETQLDNTTMPHVLRRESDGTFTFEPVTWVDRLVGDDDSNPFPGFVGQTVNHVFFHKNRFGILAGEFITLSAAADDYFNFFRATTITSLDTDPIGLRSSGDEVDVLLDSVPFNKDLVIRSTNKQFVLKGVPLLTPKEAELQPVSTYETSPVARPIVVGTKGRGDMVFLPFTRGDFAGVWELAIRDDSETNIADDITQHLPSYIPGEFLKLIGSSKDKMLAGIVSGERNRIYVYSFLWAERGDKLQSSWSYWDLGTNDVIVDIEFLGSEILVTYASENGVYLDIINVAPGQRDGTYDHVYLMDRRCDETQVTSLSFDGTYTTFNLPYQTDDPLWLVLREDFGATPRGKVLAHTRPSSTVVQIEGDYTAAQFYVGRRYTMEYEFSTIYIREQGSTGATFSNTDGRLQIARLYVHWTQSGYFEVHVTPDLRPTRIKKFTGKTTGLPSATIGVLGVEDEGKLSVPVQARNTGVTIKLVSDHFLPCIFPGVDWKGNYTAISRRL